MVTQATFDELSVKKRWDLVSLALDFVLQDIREDATTRDVAERIAARVGCTSAQASAILSRLATQGHAQAYRTGDTFVMWGKTFQRWAWRPAQHKKPRGMSPDEIERRRAIIAQHDAEPEDDQWTVRPEDV